MKLIPAKIDKDGVIWPASELPTGVRIHFDGSNYQIAEGKADEDTIINSCASLKTIVDAQKAVAVQAQGDVVVDAKVG